MLAPPWGVGAPSSGKSWIRHWPCSQKINFSKTTTTSDIHIKMVLKQLIYIKTFHSTSGLT